MPADSEPSGLIGLARARSWSSLIQQLKDRPPDEQHADALLTALGHASGADAADARRALADAFAEACKWEHERVRLGPTVERAVCPDWTPAAEQGRQRAVEALRAFLHARRAQPSGGDCVGNERGDEPLPEGAELVERVRLHLRAHERVASSAVDHGRAAVALVLVLDAARQPCVLLTRRSSRLRKHGGQYALPGGRLDPGETSVQAALRELHEELGIDLPDSAVLGQLDDFTTRSGFVITPVVADGGVAASTGSLGGAAPAEITPNPDEVAEVHRVPLSELYGPDRPSIHHIPESDRPVISLPLVGTMIFAPTAAMLYQLSEVALFGRSTRVAHFEQPKFAWR